MKDTSDDLRVMFELDTIRSPLRSQLQATTFMYNTYIIFFFQP
jgi:hypothetical protein